MFVITAADVAAIRAAFEQRGELAAAVELCRRFPGITDNLRRGSAPASSPAGGRWPYRYARSGGPMWHMDEPIGGAAMWWDIAIVVIMGSLATYSVVLFTVALLG
jgi:hypothetical protein